MSAFRHHARDTGAETGRATPEPPIATGGRGLSPAIAELASIDRWVVWKLERSKAGKPTKVPYQVGGRRKASSTDPRTWDTYDFCWASAFVDARAAGIGIVLDGSDDLMAADLDNCIGEDGSLEPWAAQVIDQLASYAELSPSGRGLRVFFRGTMPEDGRKVGRLELYRAKRFLTVTGDHLAGTPETIEPVAPETITALIGPPRENGADPGEPAAARVRAYADLPKALRQRFGGALRHDAKLKARWDGEPPGGPDQSRSAWDLSLARLMYGYGRASLGATGDRLDFDDYLAVASTWHYGKGQDGDVRHFRRCWQKATTPPPPAGDDGEPEAALRVADLPPWEPPPITSAPPLSSAAFHGPLGRIVDHLAPMTEADPAGILFSLLVMLGNWLGREFQIAVGADRHSPTLYVLLVGATSLGRKGTAAGLARLVMRCLAAGWDERNVLRSLNSGEGIALAVKNLDEASRANGNPFATEKRVMFVIGEFGDLLARASRAGSTILDTLRDAWDGGELDNTSVRNPLRMRDAAVSLLAMITSEELRERLPLRELATGTMNRFMVCAVHRSCTMPGHPPLIDGSTVQPLVDELANNIRQARSHFKIDAPVKLLHLTSEAMLDATAIRVACEPTSGSWVEAGSARSYVLMLRCALIFAVADGAAVIDRPHVAAAWALVEHSKNSLAAITKNALSDVIAQRILEHMREDPGEAPSRVKLRREVFANHVGAREFEEALALLESLGLIGRQIVQTPGRPRTVFRILG